ncbi:MAG: lipopolysaccharide A protein [Planctomycetes bacterium]|nr:lipopolysaccharide A protein [Planctomycetota bacterium]
MRPLGAQWHRAWFYATNVLQQALPSWSFRRRLASRLASVPEASLQAVHDRVAYYLRLDQPFAVPAPAQPIRDIRSDGFTTYYFDLCRLTRYFPPDRALAFLFGDIIDVPSVPTIVKSRPISQHNHNAVLLKLNQVRHYYLVDDALSFTDKRDVVVWRGKCHGRANRVACVEQFHATPGCDIGDTTPKAMGEPTWKPFMSIAEQLRCKFILSIEGKDVATNTKWIMASNSLCFMPRPRYETWFMEGRLVADQHYVLLRDDLADLLDKRAHYQAHPQQALDIIVNAKQHVAQFQDQSLEEVIGLLVLRKYFQLSGQWSEKLP